MATLEKTKHYGLQERTETLLDVSRNRLNSATPHQAPQRERVSLAALPQSVAEKRIARRKKQKKWKDTLRPDYNMGVPQLMMILEPNVVWDHVHSFNAVLHKELDAHYCPGDFFDGWHRAGRPAHGVYEGSYWELIGDCDELEAQLRKMSEAPALVEEPTLNLPAEADLPDWNDFKPLLQALPTSPTLPVLKLPPFRAPILDTEIPFIEPEYDHVPDVPEAPTEEPLPIFFPPEEIRAEEFEEPEFTPPDPPIIPAPPTAPVFGKPEFGHDWTGTRPFTVSLEPYRPPKLLDVPTWMHPPRQPPLPAVPTLDNASLEQADLDLDPLPRLELAWEAGPEPEPAYASIATTPLTMSRAPSPPRSVPSSIPSSRPLSAAPSTRPPTPPPTRPESAKAGPLPPPPQPTLPPPEREPSPPPPAQESVALSSYPSSVDSGKPRIWLNYEPPFAELPPVFMPPEPELGVTNGPEPQPEDFVIDSSDMEPLPEFVMPQEIPAPQWAPPAFKVPQWSPPCEPGPIGFMRGTAPVLILDVSGTMNPRQRGKFPTMKECAVALLDPQGELATAAGAFDVINFCNAAWAWSATYGERLSLLASAQIYYSGRQVGGKNRPSSAVAKKTKQGAVMMPTEPELLEDAQNWVSKWPDAVGHTSMLSAFCMADDHWNADCWYVLSDGLADDPMQCLEFIETRIRHQQRTPVIHTIGFFPDDAPENFEGRRYLQQLSALTGGTYQEYDPTVSRIYKEGIGFVPYDKKTEPADVRTEREWAEEALRVERRKNIRLGIAERLDVTMARVQALHHQTRVQPLIKQHQERLTEEQAAYESELARITELNAQRKAQAQAEYQQLVDEITARNQQKVDGGRGAYEAAHRAWLETYEAQVREWNELKAQKEAERDALVRDRADAIEKYRALQLARSHSPSPHTSRPVSATVHRLSNTNTSTMDSAQQAAQPPPVPRPPSASQRPLSAAGGAAAAAPQPPQAAAAPASRQPAAMPPAPGPAPTLESTAGVAALALATADAWGMAGPAEGGAMFPAANENIVGVMAADATQTHSTHGSAVVGPAVGGGGGDVGAYVASGVGGSRPTSASVEGSQAVYSGSSSRPTSARPQSATQRGKRRSSSTTGLMQVGVNSAAVASQLQQLLEEGEDEEVCVEPSQLSIDTSDIYGSAAKAPSAHTTGATPTQPHTEHTPTDLPPLEMEDSQELKRRIFPPEIVQALDESNTARLAEIRHQWTTLLSEVESRNRQKLAALAQHQDKLDAYEQAVIDVYAQSFVRDVVFGAAVKLTVNDRITRAAEAAYAAEVKRVEKENQRLAQCHTQEVEDKIFKEERYRQAHSRWERDKASAWEKHDTDVTEAKVAHEANLLRLKKEYEDKVEEIRQINEVRLREAQAHHARMVEEVNTTNRKYRAEHAEKVKARKAVEAANLARLAEAKAEHVKCLASLAEDNERKLKQAQEDHDALCERLEHEHEEAVCVAQREYEELRAFLTAHNESLLEEARKRFGEAVQQARADHEARCAQLRTTYEEDLAAARAHNEAIWPQVLRARIAQAELGRVRAFAEHIRFCANKLQLGVNFMPNTPNYDRVVEMQALNEALGKAFPDMSSHAYPWPGHELEDKTGTGWVPSPQPLVLDLKDPSIEINKAVAALGIYSKRPTHNNTHSHNRPTSARPDSPAAPGTPTHAQAPLARPQSAARARFSTVAGAGRGSASPVSHTPQSDTHDGATETPIDSPDVSKTRLVYASGGYSVGSQRPSTASPRATHSSINHAVQSPTYSPAPGALSLADANNWPAQPTALTKGCGAAGQGASGKTASPRARPASARPVVPARMSAHLEGMQSAMHRFRTAKLFGAPKVQEQQQRPATATSLFKQRLPGQFRTDFQRTEYPAVDVRALE